MVSFLKKCFGACGAAPLGMGLLYLFMTFTIPLSHTCELYRHACHYSQPDVGPVSRSGAPLKNFDHHTPAISLHGRCMACLYLTICNSTEISIAQVIVRDVIPTFFQSLPHATNPKQPECLSLNFSRAPPSTIS